MTQYTHQILPTAKVQNPDGTWREPTEAERMVLQAQQSALMRSWNETKESRLGKLRGDD